MCVPAVLAALPSLSTLSTIASVAGTVISAFGSMQQAKAQQSQEYAQAQMDAANANVTRQQDAMQWQQAQQNQIAVGQRAAALAANQRATMAGNGVDISGSTGTAADILTSTEVQKQQDLHTIQQNALWQAWGLNTQGQNYANSANYHNQVAASISPAKAFFTSLIGGASDVASNWYSMNKAGATSAPSTTLGSQLWKSNGNSLPGFSTSGTQVASYSSWNWPGG